MAARSFTVFVDEAPARPKLKKSTTEPTRLLVQDKEKSRIPSLMKSNVPLAPAQSFATSSEKENLHPITSARLGLEGMKQKGKDVKGKSALATKLLLPKAEKIEKDKPEMKKRRIGSISISNPNTNTKSVSKPKSTLARRDVKPRTALKGKAVATGKAEGDVDGNEVEVKKDNDTSEAFDKAMATMLQTQAEIDSKCYDLTVSPLADVSEAYEQVVTGDLATKETATKYHDVEDELLAKTSSLTVVSRAPSRAPSPSPAPLPSVATISAALKEDKGPAKEFSTPERKAIYSAFTFSSPSPSAKRFAASRGTGGAFAFGDLEFTPSW